MLLPTPSKDQKTARASNPSSTSNPRFLFNNLVLKSSHARANQHIIIMKITILSQTIHLSVTCKPDAAIIKTKRDTVDLKLRSSRRSWLRVFDRDESDRTVSAARQ
jgi:hypothetical protein